MTNVDKTADPGSNAVRGIERTVRDSGVQAHLQTDPSVRLRGMAGRRTNSSTMDRTHCKALQWVPQRTRCLYRTYSSEGAHRAPVTETEIGTEIGSSRALGSATKARLL